MPAQPPLSSPALDRACQARGGYAIVAIWLPVLQPMFALLLALPLPRLVAAKQPVPCHAILKHASYFVPGQLRQWKQSADQSFLKREPDGPAQAPVPHMHTRLNAAPSFRREYQGRTRWKEAFPPGPAPAAQRPERRDSP